MRYGLSHCTHSSGLNLMKQFSSKKVNSKISPKADKESSEKKGQNKEAISKFKLDFSEKVSLKRMKSTGKKTKSAVPKSANQFFEKEKEIIDLTEDIDEESKKRSEALKKGA